MDVFIITLISLLSLISLFIFLLEIRLERFWVKRSNINFSTFETYYPMFSYNPNKAKVSLYIGIVVISIVISYILIVFQTYNLYSIVIFLPIILQVITIYIHISRKKYNLNLEKFDEIYNLINQNRENRDKLETSITKFEDKITNIEAHNNNLINFIDESISSNENLDFTIHMNPLIEKLVLMKGLLSSYDSGVFDKFDDELHEFLKVKTEPTHFIGAFQSEQKYNSNNLLDVAIKQINGAYSNYIERNIETCKFKSDTSLLELLKEIKNYNIKVSESSLFNVLSYLNQHNSNREMILTRLTEIAPLSNNVLITSILKNDYIWLIDVLNFNDLTTEAYTDFFSAVINEDKYDLAYNILTNKHLMDLQAIQKLIDGVKKPNQTTDLFKSFIMIQQQQKALYTPANEYEFKIFAIRDYAKSTGDNSLIEFADNIISSLSFDSSINKINDAYDQIFTSNEKLFKNSTKLLFLISNNKVVEKYINIYQTIKISYELKHRFMFADLKMLNFIMSLVLLMEENKESNIVYLKTIIEDVFKSFDQDLDISDLNLNTKGNVLELIYHKGVNYNTEKYKNILSRVESSRLMYDQINQLIGVI